MNRMPNDDDTLLRLLIKNPQEGFTRLIKAGGGFRFIDRLAADAGVYDRAFVEDLKTETLLALYHNVRAGRLTRLSGKLSTYLYGVAQKILANQLRKNQNEAKRIERFFTIDDTEFELPKWDNTPLDAYELQVKKCLDNLSEDCRKLLKERFRQEKPDYEFLKELLGFASAAVAKQRVYACLEKIRNCVKLISAMDRDEAAILELLRRFLDDGDALPAKDLAAVAALLRDDPRAATLLEEEKKLRAALGRIARRDLLDQARAAIGASESSARMFLLPPYRWVLAAAAFAALAVGGWWFFLRPQPAEHPAAAARDRRTVFEQRLPVWTSPDQPLPTGDTLLLTIKETRVSVSRYTLTATELELESPPGRWTLPPDIRLYRAAPQDALLMQLNNRLYRLSPTDVQQLLPTASPD